MDFEPFFTSSAGVDYTIAEKENGDLVLRSDVDVSPVLERNKAMMNHNDGYSPTREFRRVFSIPGALVQYFWEVEGWSVYDPEHADRLVKILNDPDWRLLRTAEGHLGFSNGVIR